MFVEKTGKKPDFLQTPLKDAIVCVRLACVQPLLSLRRKTERRRKEGKVEPARRLVSGDNFPERHVFL